MRRGYDNCGRIESAVDDGARWGYNNMIPPPTGLRRFKSVEPRKAKRSLPQQFSFWSSDWPSANQQVVG